MRFSILGLVNGIWMFHSRLINNKFNRLHERCLRIVYSENQSTFEELPEKDNTVSVHQRHFQFLATELYKHSFSRSCCPVISFIKVTHSCSTSTK